jgi:Mlc titration factor MtfA (ptsG expression regulator)
LELLFKLLYAGYEELKFQLYYKPFFERHLISGHSYFNKLPLTLKNDFLRLVRDHYEYFDFIPRQSLKITREIKTIISGVASQLVFNLPSESLTFFEKIIIYPDYYQSRITNKLHKGEVNPGLRLIVFSWRGVMEGLNRSDDGLNLLLHEFAHALWLENKIMHQEYTVLNPALVTYYEQAAVEEVVKMQSDDQHFFRKYALTNKEEFFAVAVENFFERPGSFKNAAPQLYQSLVNLFKQDLLISRYR